MSTYDERVKRTVEVAEYYVKNKTTVREAGKHFGISKSTVYLDLTKRLKNVNQSLYLKAIELLKENKEIRNIRGGESTKLLHKRKRMETND